MQAQNAFGDLFGGGGGQGGQGGKRYNNPYINNIVESIRVEGIKESKFNQDKLDRLYRYPANYHEALVHKRATKYGYNNKKLRSGQDVPICPDCENYPSTIDINLCYHTHPTPPKQKQDVFLLQSGVSMYFTFVKMTMLYLILRFLVVDVYTTIVSLRGQYCNNYAAANTAQLCTFTISGYNLKAIQDQVYLNVMDILNLLLTILSIVFFTVYRKISYKLQNWLDYNDVSQQDYSVLLQNIPITCTQKGGDMKLQFDLKQKIEYKIREWFPVLGMFTNERQFNRGMDKDFWKFIYSKYKVQVENAEIVTGITLCYDLTELDNINNVRTEFINDYILECSQNQGEQRVSTTKPRQIQMINHEYLNTCYKYALDQSSSFILSHFTGKAFISFQYQHYRDYFLREYQYNKQFLTINKKPIKVSASSKPEDIYWKNMKIHQSQRKKNIVYSYIILAMTLIISFAGLLGLEFWRLSYQGSAVAAGKSYTSSVGGKFIVILMSILTTLINYVLTMATYILSDRQGHQTKNQRLRHLVLKTIIAQGINTVLLYFILNFLKPTNPLSSLGLVTKVMYLVIISGLFNVIWYMVLPMHLIYSLINKYKYNETNPINLFQFQLNQNMQYTEFDFAPTYAFYIVFAYIACFYGIITPLASPLLIIIFFLQYWVDKYNLFRRNSYPNDLGASINRLIFKSFEMCILITAVGHLIWDDIVHYDVSPGFRAMNIINLVLSALYIGLVIFAPQSIANKIFKQNTQYEHHQYRYYIDKGRFRKTFYRENPATSCLKQAKIAQIKEEKEDSKDNKDSNNNNSRAYIPEAPEPELITERQFDRYIQLSNKDTKIDKYDKAEVEFYENMDNANWDEITAELVRNAALGDLFGGGGGGGGGQQQQNFNFNQQQNFNQQRMPNSPQQKNMAMVNPAFFLG